jgi:hypothetical protein
LYPQASSPRVLRFFGWLLFFFMIAWAPYSRLRWFY